MGLELEYTEGSQSGARMDLEPEYSGTNLKPETTEADLEPRSSREVPEPQ